MGLFPNAQETIFRYGEYMEGFHDAFQSNEINFGSPEDFFSLCENLKTNLPLRAELAKLTRSLLNKENNKISVRTVLAIIAIASGGPDITTSDRDMSKPLTILIGFLTNAVGCRQINPDDLDDMCISALPFADENPLPIPALDIPPDPGINLNDAPPTALPGNAEDFKQWFTRLELNALEVKLHLDSIDQRIGRMEPRLESVPQLVTSSPERFQRASRLQAQQSYTTSPAATALSEPEPEPGELLLHGPEFGGVPFESYDDSSPFFLSGAGVILLAILFGLAIGAGVFLYQHRADQYPAHAYQYMQEHVSALRQPHATAPVAAASAVAPDTNANQPDPPAVPAANATSATPIPQPGSPASESTPPPTPSVEISSNAMTANILSAPKPIYPRLAQQNHTQGRVILQGTISSDGAVEDLHGIKGPRMLQDVAVDAVSTWRYKPYLVNGQPMPVAILITIDFTLQPGTQLSSGPTSIPQQSATDLTPLK